MQEEVPSSSSESSESYQPDSDTDSSSEESEGREDDIDNEVDGENKREQKMNDGNRKKEVSKAKKDGGVKDKAANSSIKVRKSTVLSK